MLFHLEDADGFNLLSLLPIFRRIYDKVAYEKSNLELLWKKQKVSQNEFNGFIKPRSKSRTHTREKKSTLNNSEN